MEFVWYNTPMETILIILLVFLAFKLIGSHIGPSMVKTCDENHEPHKWDVKGEGYDRYMVCTVCKMLPGGEKEQGDSNA